MTQLVGNSVGTPTSGLFPDGTTILTQSFVASASGTATTASFYFVGTFATDRNFVVAVFDNADDLLAVSNQGSTGTTSGWKTATFASGPAISSGVTYRLGVFPDGTIDFATDGGTDQALYQSGLTFPTAPDPFVSNGSDNAGLLFIYLDGTAGDVLMAQICL